MPSLARTDLESLLRVHKLDRTLTSELPSPFFHDELTIAATNLAPLDERLGGGFPRGQLSELVGPRSSGRTSLLLQTLAAATSRGELVALVDTLDAFDVESASAAGIDLDRFLWIRGHVVINPGLCRDLNQRALEQAIKALTLFLQAGNFGLVVLDVADAAREATGRLPFTTWLRLQRMIENSQTACVLVGTEPMARSSAGLTLNLGRALGAGNIERSHVGSNAGSYTAANAASREGIRFRARSFDGLDVASRVVRARARMPEEATVAFRTVASSHV
jgi:KaiC/GvpD/RAD55 family RecA-like ATPase